MMNEPWISHLCPISFEKKYKLTMFGDGCKIEFGITVPSLGTLDTVRPREVLGDGT